MAGELGFFDDLADSLSPWRTADLGCVAVRKVPKDLRNGIPSIGEETGPTSAAARQALALKAQQDAERQLKCKSSLALIQLIQAAIERRETLLAQMGESIGTPVDAARALAQMSIGRLALEDYTDQALAREELAPVDLAAARVDMSELLPRKAYDPGYAHATAAHAQRSAASMGSFLGMRPTGSANGDSYSYYGYDDAPEGYGSYGYYDAAQKPESDGYEYYTDEEARAAATAAELNTMSAASVTAMALSAGKPEAAARKQGSGGGTCTSTITMTTPPRPTRAAVRLRPWASARRPLHRALDRQLPRPRRRPWVRAPSPLYSRRRCRPRRCRAAPRPTLASRLPALRLRVRRWRPSPKTTSTNTTATRTACRPPLLWRQRQRRRRWWRLMRRTSITSLRSLRTPRVRCGTRGQKSALGISRRSEASTRSATRPTLRAPKRTRWPKSMTSACRRRPALHHTAAALIMPLTSRVSCVPSITCAQSICPPVRSLAPGGRTGHTHPSAPTSRDWGSPLTWAEAHLLPWRPARALDRWVAPALDAGAWRAQHRGIWHHGERLRSHNRRAVRCVRWHRLNYQAGGR